MSVHRDEVPMAPDAVKPPMPVGALPVVPGQAPGLVDQSAKNNINFHDQLDEARDLMKVVVADRETTPVDLEAAMVEARNDVSFGIKPKLEPSVKIGIQRPVKGGNNLFDGLSANSDLKARGKSIPLEQRKNTPIAAQPAFMGYPVRLGAAPSFIPPAPDAACLKCGKVLESGRHNCSGVSRLPVDSLPTPACPCGNPDVHRYGDKDCWVVPMCQRCGGAFTSPHCCECVMTESSEANKNKVIHDHSTSRKGSAAVPSEPTKSTSGAHVNGDMPARPATEAEMVKIAAQIEAGRAKAEATGRKLSEAILAEHGVRLDLAGRLAKAAQRALIAKHEHVDLDGDFNKELDIQPRCERCDLDLALSALVLEWLLIAE